MRSWGPVGETFDVWGLQIGGLWVTKCDPGGLLENLVRVVGPKMLILGISMAKTSKFFSVWRFWRSFGLQSEFLGAVGKVFDVWRLQIGGFWATK